MYLLDTPTPTSGPARWGGSGTGTSPCPHLSPWHGASRCEESSRALGSSAGSASDELRETPVVPWRGWWVRWYPILSFHCSSGRLFRHFSQLVYRDITHIPNNSPLESVQFNGLGVVTVVQSSPQSNQNTFVSSPHSRNPILIRVAPYPPCPSPQ